MFLFLISPVVAQIILFVSYWFTSTKNVNGFYSLFSFVCSILSDFAYIVYPYLCVHNATMLFSHNLSIFLCVLLTLKVLVTTIDALGYFETG